MPPITFDWRDDPMGTVAAVPARFMRFDLHPEGTRPPAGFHTHEESNALETFVVLEGALRFEIGSESVVAEAGQALFVYADEPHRVSCASAEPAILFLTV